MFRTDDRTADRICMGPRDGNDMSAFSIWLAVTLILWAWAVHDTFDSRGAHPVQLTIVNGVTAALWPLFVVIQTLVFVVRIIDRVVQAR